VQNSVCYLTGWHCYSVNYHQCGSTLMMLQSEWSNLLTTVYYSNHVATRAIQWPDVAQIWFLSCLSVHYLNELLYCNWNLPSSLILFVIVHSLTHQQVLRTLWGHIFSRLGSSFRSLGLYFLEGYDYLDDSTAALSGWNAKVLYHSCRIVTAMMGL